jgi:glycosyltransferase involved in cell wall biosynthesis
MNRASGAHGVGQNENRGLPPGARGRRLAGAPTASLVIASTGDRTGLDRCLAALLPQCAERDVEVVVARSCTKDEYDTLAAAYPDVLFMPASTGSPLAQLRAVGTSAADGDIVFFTDDGRTEGPEFVAARLAFWAPEGTQA